MKNKKQIISRLLWMGNIFYLYFAWQDVGLLGLEHQSQEQSNRRVPALFRITIIKERFFFHRQMEK
ncbi:hypothetical protein NIA73_08055 [Anaerobutyricum hallii]|nr:hypothetical protein [Anaerobutyricum hallii]